MCSWFVKLYSIHPRVEASTAFCTVMNLLMMLAAVSFLVPPRMISPPLQRRAPIVSMDAERVPDTFTLPDTFKPPPVRLPQIGIGTLAWGNPRRGWGVTFNSTDLEEAYAICMDAGINLFDTSEVYGYQGVRLFECSEQLLSRLIEKSLVPPLISTKFMPVPWTNLLAGGGVRIGRQAVVEAARCVRLPGLTVHIAAPLVSVDACRTVACSSSAHAAPHARAPQPLASSHSRHLLARHPSTRCAGPRVHG